MKENTEFLRLYEKLKRNALNPSEYQLFLEYIKDVNNAEEVQKVLDAESLQYLSQNKKKNKKDKGLNGQVKMAWLMKAAAVLLLVVGLVGIMSYFSDLAGSNLVYTTGNGETLDILLPDSSRVTLNANSSLVWNESESIMREVSLQGEAYFEILHMKDNRPFIVSTEASKITVLGTSFNVNSRDEADKIYLAEGSIQLERPENISNDKILMKPGEAAVVYKDNENIEISHSKIIENEVAWKKGLLRFSDVQLSTIVERLEEIYGKEIRVTNPSALDKEMEFTLPYANWKVTSMALALAVNLELIENKGFVELK
ncbi:FecR family protein [Membranihabitans marinus]|uniref:FecR family protein n=1 Tax=Membranihabitans marinus TaxID=1227546 RepID=UPI001F2E090C|nr:FecR domain-containing protein [Membranihabitans marinus]